MPHSVEELESRVHSAHGTMKSLGDDDFHDDLWKYIHLPGFTTPAEFLLVIEMLNTIESLAKTIAQLKATTLRAAAAITEAAEG